MLLLACQMACDVMRGFMPHNKRQLISVAHRSDQRKVKRQYGAAILIKRLKGVGLLTGAVIQHDLEIAVQSSGARLAFALGDRLNRAHNLGKCLQIHLAGCHLGFGRRLWGGRCARFALRHCRTSR